MLSNMCQAMHYFAISVWGVLIPVLLLHYILFGCNIDFHYFLTLQFEALSRFAIGSQCPSLRHTLSRIRSSSVEVGFVNLCQFHSLKTLACITRATREPTLVLCLPS